MELVQVIQKIVQDAMKGSALTDLTVGTVTSASPLEITTRTTMQPLRAQVLYLTDAVIPKTLQFSSDTPGVICYVNGEAQPVSGGTVTLNPALAVGDKVLLLRVQNGQKFVILSKIYEGGGA